MPSNLKKLLTENPQKQLICGLRSCTREEVEDLVFWLKKEGIKHTWKIVDSKGRPLMYNGVLLVNRELSPHSIRRSARR